MKKRKEKEQILNQFINIIIRYALLIALAIPNLWIFYFIFTPFTLYAVYFLLDIFLNVSLSGTTIYIERYVSIEIIGACVAGSAYYLLSILNLSTPNLKFKKRIKLLLLAFVSFFVVNILRIFLLSLIYLSGSSFFDITHKFFWYFGSIVLVVGIWFVEVKSFKIRKIPIYSDMRFLYNLSLRR